MLAAFLALAVATPSHGDCRLEPSDPKIARLVAMAWQEADGQADPATPQQVAASADAKTDAQKLEEAHARDLASDREIGKKYSEQADKELKASTNAEAIARLQRIAAELAPIANAGPVQVLWGDKRLNKYDYVFKLVEGKDVNAFSLPGGYVYFYEGLLDYAESDDEVAGVVAHEIAHASLRHLATLEREQSRVMNVQIPLILLAILAGGSRAAGTTIAVSQLISQATGSGWSVKAEQSADYAGFQYMAQSRFNPTGMLTLMERLANDERNRPYVDWGIYRTHPPGRERAESLASYLRQAGVSIRRSQVTRSFRTTVKPGDDGTVQLVFGDKPLARLAGSEALARADEAADRLNVFFDTTPELFEVKAGEDGSILWRRQPLFRLTREDAAAAQKDLPALRNQTVRNIQTALFSIGLRVWSSR